jgi:LuxR family quorum sensing-dependent transcriptional regulator
MQVSKLRRVPEFFESCAGSVGLDNLIAEFRQIAGEFGFTSSVCGAWAGIGQQRIHRFFFNDWPDSWLTLYTERNFFDHDPFVMEARRSIVPYQWTRLEPARSWSKQAQEIYDTAREYGWKEVVGVPIHGPFGYQGMVTMATKQSVLLSAYDLAAIESISRAIHDRCRKEIGFGSNPEDVPKFSAREIECMQWVAAGKTDWEIAQLLGISSSTVHFHIERAKKKLNLSSRTEAVARLTLLGLL